MKVYYSRISSADQNEARQMDNIENFDYVFTDKCSGSIPLFERPKGSQVKKLMDDVKLSLLEIHSIDRLGRNTLSVLQTWKDFTEKGIRIVCRNPHFQNLDENGNTDMFSELMISILSIMADFERKMSKERQREGIEKAKLAGRYAGRKINTIESKAKFLAKPKCKKVIHYLNAGYTYKEISKIVGCSYSTINKVRCII